MACRCRPEAFAGHHRDVVFFQQRVGKILATHAGAAHIQHQIHRALGGHEADGVLSRKNVLRQQTAALERRGDLCLETGALVQREQRRVLNVSGHAIGRVGRQIGQVLDRIHGPDDPAAARAGHRVAF